MSTLIILTDNSDMSHRKLPLDISKSDSIVKLSEYTFPTPDSETDDSIEDSVDETKCLLETPDSSRTHIKIGQDTFHNGIPITGQSVPMLATTPVVTHPLAIQISAPSTYPSPMTSFPISNQFPGSTLFDASPSPYAPQPVLARENTAPTQTNWPPLMLRPILVNGKPYYTMGELGRGATSVVHRAVDLDWGFFALKSVSLEETDQMQLDCYQNEISILQNLREHVHVIHMFDYEYSPTNKLLYVVMECGQLDLARIIKENNNQPFETYHIQTFWHDMLMGVTAIHSMDIIHSDLKPNNFVLVDTRLKLIDFGIACSLNDDATSFEREGRWGTPNYMAPEMILSIPKNNSLTTPENVCKISQAADIWSLGCILYKLTYGTTPFQHISDKIQKWRAITDPREAISFQEDVPSSLLQVLICCLDRNSRKRPTCLQLLSNKFLT